jgi:hypothetical protein
MARLSPVNGASLTRLRAPSQHRVVEKLGPNFPLEIMQGNRLLYKNG